MASKDTKPRAGSADTFPFADLPPVAGWIKQRGVSEYWIKDLLIDKVPGPYEWRVVTNPGPKDPFPTEKEAAMIRGFGSFHSVVHWSSADTERVVTRLLHSYGYRAVTQVSPAFGFAVPWAVFVHTGEAWHLVEGGVAVSSLMASRQSRQAFATLVPRSIRYDMERLAE